MAYDIQPVDVSSLKRNKVGPVYDFVEQATRQGTAFRIGNDGYAIIAPPNCLLPRFVVELQLPELAVVERYAEVIRILTDRSCGMLWFDSSDVHAYDLAWRMRMMMTAGPPLLAPADADKTQNVPDNGSDSIRSATLDDLRPLTDLFGSFPTWKGGQTPAAVLEHVKNNSVAVLEKNNEIIGAVVTLDADEHGTLLSSGVIAEKYRNQGIGTQFVRALSRQSRTSYSRPVVFSTSPDSPATFRIAMRLNSKVVKQSFVAILGSRSHF